MSRISKLASADQVDWFNCPFPPFGNSLDHAHPLYEMLFFDNETLPDLVIELNTNSKTSSFPTSDMVLTQVCNTILEKKQKAWRAFLIQNPEILQLSVNSIVQRWGKVMGKHGRAIGAPNIYSNDLVSWEPEMGVWHPGMGPYDYLHPLNDNLPPWQPLIAVSFHRIIRTDPNIFPLYPRATHLESHPQLTTK